MCRSQLIDSEGYSNVIDENKLGPMTNDKKLVVLFIWLQFPSYIECRLYYAMFTYLKRFSAFGHWIHLYAVDIRNQFNEENLASRFIALTSFMNSFLYIEIIRTIFKWKLHHDIFSIQAISSTFTLFQKHPFPVIYIWQWLKSLNFFPFY